ncbi:MAG: alpha/beta hydrolase [Clostridiales bacterium]|nr:alpha/beta hydrolase [Clostridiales bacterium]
MIHHITKGNGETDIIFLHGFGGSVKSFAFAAEYMSGQCRTTLVDLYGFGETPEPETPLTVDGYAESIVRLIEHYGMRSVVLVAHSFGGRVAMRLADGRCGAVKKLLLVDSAGIIPKRTFKYYLRVYAYKLLKKLRIELKAGSADYKSLSAVMKKTFVNIVNFDLTPHLYKISCPTLIIWGENDAETPMYMAKILHENIPDSALIVFENCGHFAYLDEPRKFLKILEAFAAG